MSLQLYTIGVYGFDATSFFDTLQTAKIDVFCDVRARRGVRGTEYTFANSQRLQAGLEARQIRYVHLLAFAPTDAMRQAQYAVDKATKTGKRARIKLSEAYIASYQQQILADFDGVAWRSQLPADAQRVALFCVERDPAACHRSLLANAIAQTLKIEPIHLMP
jgi:uncharacterized protein (DUF488 family)